MLALLLLLCGMAFPGTARAQGGPETFVGTCIPGLELPAELVELDLAGLKAALQALVAQNAEASVTLTEQGFLSGTVRANLLLADEAVLVALLEGQAVNATYEFPEGEPVIVAIEASTAEDCTDTVCVSGIELPAALADLDEAGLRAALEGLIAGDADATVPVTVTGTGEPFRVRADLLLGLSDPLLEAVLTGEPVSVSVTGDDVIISIALPGPECEEDGGPQEPEPGPGTIPDNQQGGGKDTTPDGQQGGGDKDTGAGADQQGGVKPTAPDSQQTGAGKTPDNRQGGGGDTVTKTFRLTLNGDVPAHQVFAVKYGQQQEGDAKILVFCGEMEELADFPGYEAQTDCVGDGTVYTQSVELPQGSVLYSTFTRYYADGEENFFAITDGETLNADMTNSAWYTFGKGTGAGDDKQTPDNQQDGEDKDAGAGDEQETPNNQQDDIQDDQQGEMPEEMPDTGAGGLAGGATIPVGNAVAGLTMLVGAGYAAIRRR